MRRNLLITLSFATFAAAALIGHNSRHAMHNYPLHHSFARDVGWINVNVTDTSYKYERREHGQTRKKNKNGNWKDSKGNKKKPPQDWAGAIVHAVDAAWNGLKGFGVEKKVKITWYTGQDLLLPSCWAKSGWAPSDESFACAVTLNGWSDKPECFSFLELCNGPERCIFVRVVDTCAGCKSNSQHVDLTKAAFRALAPLDKGVLNVQMRKATPPKNWRTDWWGPQKV